MSPTDTHERVRTAVDGATARAGERVSPARALAVTGVALVIGAFLSVLHEILVITGDPTQLVPVVAGGVVAGTVLAQVIRPRTAGLIGGVVVAASTYLYIDSLPGGVEFFVLLAPAMNDVVSLLSGLSVLRIVNANIWALSVAPGPVFLAWYLCLRKHYVAACVVSGGALALLVLTSDATTATTLVGALGVTLAIAFGDCDRRGERLRNADGVVVVLSTMVVLTLFVGVVPGAADSVVSTEGIGSQDSTIESSLVHAGDSVAVTGSVELSPEVRYTVEASEEAYWRVGTYDRYTGGGWVRSGTLRNYQGRLDGPPGESRTLEQSYTAESSIATLPAANQPTRIDDVPVPVQVTEAGSFEPASPLQEGESYRVESQVPTAAGGELRNAGADYPDDIGSRYTQLPESTPDRVAERTERLTANADNPYDTARVLEQWLQNNYEYSLEVERPRGNVADSFLFEMDAGYCTYFATTMVTMLRTQGIPARFVVGYTPGQQVDQNEWVVRGYNSHAWVEVYFPEHGWIAFDPTPSGPRESTERQTLAEARNDNTSSDIDTSGTLDSEFDRGTPAQPDDDGLGGSENGSETSIDTPTGPSDGGGEETGISVPTIPLPSREQLAFGLLVIAGLGAAVRRTGIDSRLSRELWLRRIPGDDPEAVVTGVYHRVIYLEERFGREKGPGETPRQFLASTDERARRVGELYERARYGRGIDEDDAREATDHLEALLEERSRLPWVLNRNASSR
jgi:transglutaminase-like putative cysteine protease